MTFIQARNYTKANRDHCRLIVIHTMESSEKPGTARAVAKWFAGNDAPRASAHLCVDPNEAIECVLQQDVAWAAPGANHDGYHVELAGRAAQKPGDWSDASSTAILRRAAGPVALVCQAWEIPVVRLTVDQVKDGKTKGFCGHVDVSKAFKKSDHWDPGPHFPWDLFLAHVYDALADLQAGQIGFSGPKEPA
jgi:hypothetical protein